MMQRIVHAKTAGIQVQYITTLSTKLYSNRFDSSLRVPQLRCIYGLFHAVQGERRGAR